MLNESKMEFVNDAIESAKNYYDSANTMKHSRIVLSVTKVTRINAICFRLNLSQRLKHTDSALLHIQSHKIPLSFYEDLDNRYINKKFYKFTQSGTQSAFIDIEIDKDFLDIFCEISAYDIFVVSDLKFLIDNVGKWYKEYGHLIEEPPSPSLKPSEYIFQGHESIEQKEAVGMALSNKYSYVWGAPGTGKTQVVLADCVLSYLEKQKQVLIVAPTNNALEQTLYSIIHVLESPPKSISMISRLGVPSDSFALKYGCICQDLVTQNKIKLLESAIKELKLQQETQKLNQTILDEYQKFCGYYHIYKEKRKLKEELNQKYLLLSERVNETALHLPSYRTTKNSLQTRLNQIEYRTATLSFKLKSFFTKKEVQELKKEKEELDIRLKDCLEKLSVLENENDSLDHSIKQYTDNIKDTEKIIETSKNEGEKIANTVLGVFQNFEKAMDLFDQRMQEISETHFDDSIEDQIEEKKQQLEEIRQQKKTQQKGQLVFACTLDYLFAHYKNLIDDGINSALLSHVFLDEAAYCPLIKAGVIFSLHAPITLFGDHMQLPPICEASKRIIEDPALKVFIWAMSALYFPKLFPADYSLEILFRDYIKGIPPYYESLKRAVLPQTFRFGDNLASVLNHFVYKNNFCGIKNRLTEITAVHAKRGTKEQELRANNGEARAIREYILNNNLQNYVVLSPYRVQQKNLCNLLKGITLPDNILTIHASQGREWDTVILSVVDSSQKFFVDSTTPQGLFTLNTAISRAKKNIVIVCNLDYWKRHVDSQLIGKLTEVATTVLDYSNL